MSQKPDIPSLLPDRATVKARRDSLVRELGTRGSARRLRMGPRRAVLGVAALLALSGGGAWAAGVFSADEIAINAGVACYETPSIHSGATIFHTAADPVAKCARLWREGVVDTRLRRLEREGKIEPRPNRASPHLVACTGENKPVVVFPGPDSLCERLGLVPLPADYAPLGRAHARAFAALHQVGELPPPASNCPSPQAAADRARNRLPVSHKDVEVTIDGDGPCAREYRAVGDHIAVVTISRAEGAVQWKGARIGIALGSLIESLASDRCHAPDVVARKARRRLAAAGLGDVAVRMSGDGPCVNGGFGTDDEYRWVEFFAE